ncbi:MAG: hypothetical protein RRC07_15315, partial [Anaerolineae bacterium]|nr:hypothetical protein [Anaerolineae bacterium]
MLTARSGSPRVWYLLPIVALALVLLLSAGAGNTAANDSSLDDLSAPNQTNSDSIKVIAPRGALEEAPEGFTLWHDYGSFALYRTTSEALNALPADIRAQLVEADQMERLWFDSGPIEVETAIQPEAMSAMSTTVTTEAAAENSDEILHLVQFVGPIKDEWLQAIEATGANLVQYIASNGYLLWADGLSRSLLDEMAAEGEFVQFSGPLPPSVKIGPALSARLAAGGDLDEPVPVVIQMVSHKLEEESEHTIADLAQSQESSWAPVLKFQNGNFTVRLGDVEAIANLPDVYWVEERLERELLDEVQGQIVAGNFNADQSGPASPGYLAWLASYGFSTNPADYPVVDITDDGIGNGTTNSGD